MCGRFGFDVDEDSLFRRYKIKVTPKEILIPRYNIAPSQNIVTLLLEGKNLNLTKMKWGLIPSWAKDPKIGYRMINARAETLASKPSFSTIFKTRRCILPATYFFEWKRSKTQNVPYIFKPKDDKYFSFAGLYDVWKDPQDNLIYTTTIITTSANDVVGPVHDRMPVILEPDNEMNWLKNNDIDFLQTLLKPLPDDELESYPVNPKVNNPAFDRPEVIEPM